MDLVRSLAVLRVENSNWRMVLAVYAVESRVVRQRRRNIGQRQPEGMIGLRVVEESAENFGAANCFLQRSEELS